MIIGTMKVINANNAVGFFSANLRITIADVMKTDLKPRRW